MSGSSAFNGKINRRLDDFHTAGDVYENIVRREPHLGAFCAALETPQGRGIVAPV